MNRITRKRIAVGAMGAALFSGLLFPHRTAQLLAQAKPPAEPLKLKVGDTAPDFTLLAFDGKELKKISLHDYRGKKNVVLAFYVFAFTGG